MQINVIYVNLNLSFVILLFVFNVVIAESNNKSFKDMIFFTLKLPQILENLKSLNI